MAFPSRTIAAALAVSLALTAGGVAAHTESVVLPAAELAAEPLGEVSEQGHVVTLRGLDLQTRTRLGAPHVDVRVRPVGQAGSGIAVAVIDAEDGALILRPRFPLLPGVAYEAVLPIDGEASTTLGIAVADIDLPLARVASIFPAGDVLPANTLRLYIQFDAPMARGRGHDRIRLETAEGERLDDSFLNLRAELWSDDQTRRTLLLDPGRIKRGVGSNLQGGAPLEAGRGYRIVVDAALPDALGRPMAEPFVHDFRVGPAERRAIDPTDWTIASPALGTRIPLEARFDRLMDRAITARALVPLDGESNPIAGTAEATDRGWRFVPDAPWADALRLRIDPVLEDVAGNTICAPFDTVAGTGVRCEAPVVLDIAHE